MGRRSIPPRILKLLQEQPHLFAAKKGRCLPPRILKLQREHHRSFTNRERFVPSRILELQQQQEEGSMMETERFIPPRLLKLQQEKLQRRSKLQETHVEVQQEDILLLWQTLMDGPRDFLGRQEPLLHLQRGWIEVRQSMPEQLQERQQLVVEIEQTLAQKEYQSRLEQNLANETVIDNARLTSFLKQDSSFLTPWNWNGRNDTEVSQIQIDQEKDNVYIPESYFSYTMSP